MLQSMGSQSETQLSDWTATILCKFNIYFGIDRPKIRERTSLAAQTVKNLPSIPETWVQSLGCEDPLEEGMATHSSILAYMTKSPWMEESGGLQRCGWATKHSTNEGKEWWWSQGHRLSTTLFPWACSFMDGLRPIVKKRWPWKEPELLKNIWVYNNKKEKFASWSFRQSVGFRIQTWKNQGHSPIWFVVHLPWSQTAYLWNRSATQLKSIL